MNTGHLLALVPLIVALICAAIVDLRHRRIPNALTFTLLLAGLARGALTGGFAGLGHSLLGFAVGASIPLALFAINAIGGGDVKLMAAIGAWLGPVPAVLIYIVTCLVGLVIVLTQALIHGRTKALFRNSALIALSALNIEKRGVKSVSEDGRSFTSIDKPLPFAVPVLVATLLVLCLAMR